MEPLLVVAAGLWFIYVALMALMVVLAVPSPRSNFVIFVYCLLVGLYLIYVNSGGTLFHPVR